MREKIERLKGAIKAAAILCRRWKHNRSGIIFVRDPVFRATILCTALAHSRGRIHATRMHGADHVVPDRDSNYRVIDTLQKQEKLLRGWIDKVGKYAESAWCKEGKGRPAALDIEEVAIIREILDSTEAWLAERQEVHAAVG